jgi:hypothetical protein
MRIGARPCSFAILSSAVRSEPTLVSRSPFAPSCSRHSLRYTEKPASMSRRMTLTSDRRSNMYGRLMGAGTIKTGRVVPVCWSYRRKRLSDCSSTQCQGASCGASPASSSRQPSDRRKASLAASIRNSEFSVISQTRMVVATIAPTGLPEPASTAHVGSGPRTSGRERGCRTRRARSPSRRRRSLSKRPPIRARGARALKIVGAIAGPGDDLIRHLVAQDRRLARVEILHGTKGSMRCHVRPTWTMK